MMLCNSCGHLVHSYVPWFYKTPYDMECDQCGKPAAMEFGGHPLCDCCATDWSEHMAEVILPSDLTVREMIANPDCKKEYARAWEIAYQDWRE